MATTSIWAVKGWLGKVVLYIENPDKTDNPKFYWQEELTDVQTQSLSDVIDYACFSFSMIFYLAPLPLFFQCSHMYNSSLFLNQLYISANILLTVMAQRASNRLKESVLQLSKLT